MEKRPSEYPSMGVYTPHGWNICPNHEGCGGVQNVNTFMDLCVDNYKGCNSNEIKTRSRKSWLEEHIN